MRIGLDARRMRVGRGLDRYVCELVTALAALDSETEFVLLTDGSSLPPHVRLPANSRTEPASRRLRAIYRPGLGWYGRLRFRDLDLFHFPTADVWYSRYCRTVVTLMDLIPLKHPQWYFSSGREDRAYQRHLEYIRAHAAVVLTGTEFTRQDIRCLLGIPAERISVTYAGVDTDRFFPLDTGVARQWLQAHFPVPEPFLLYLGPIEPGKNVQRLVKAYLQTKTSAHLVLVGGRPSEKSQAYASGVEELVRGQAAQDRVHFLGRAPDDQTLRALYSLATAFVFPSIEEGFGLPPLEALACGAAVITSNSTSLPEVVGGAALLVDPEDTDSLAAAMSRILQCEEQRQELRSRARLQATTFPWPRVADLTLAAYRRALSA